MSAVLPGAKAPVIPEPEPKLAIVARLLVHALGAAVFAAPLVRGEATALAALGSAIGAGVAPAMARELAIGAARAFRIEGHADATGPDAYNLKLSVDRAAAARAYLVQRHRLPAGALVVEGYGERRLRNLNNPASGDNRRVEIMNVAR